MQLQRVERVSLHETDGLSAEALPKPAAILNPNGQGCAAISVVEAVKADLPDEVARFDNPREILIDEPLNPPRPALHGHRADIATASSVHAKDIRIATQARPRRCIFGPRRAQLNGAAGQDREVSFAHAWQVIRRTATKRRVTCRARKRHTAPIAHSAGARV